MAIRRAKTERRWLVNLDWNAPNVRVELTPRPRQALSQDDISTEVAVASADEFLARVELHSRNQRDSHSHTPESHYVDN